VLGAHAQPAPPAHGRPAVSEQLPLQQSAPVAHAVPNAVQPVSGAQSPPVQTPEQQSAGAAHATPCGLHALGMHALPSQLPEQHSAAVPQASPRGAHALPSGKNPSGVTTASRDVPSSPPPSPGGGGATSSSPHPTSPTMDRTQRPASSLWRAMPPVCANSVLVVKSPAGECGARRLTSSAHRAPMRS